MIILHFAEYASGGVATYLKNLIDYQVNEKDIEKVYLLVSKKNTDLELLNKKNEKLRIITYDYTRSPLGIFKLLSQSRVIKNMHPDIVHLHSSFAGLIRIKFFFSDDELSNQAQLFAEENFTWTFPSQDLAWTVI